MKNYDGPIDFAELDLVDGYSEALRDSAPAFEPAYFRDENESFEFEAMTEVPHALLAFISHQHTFDL